MIGVGSHPASSAIFGPRPSGPLPDPRLRCAAVIGQSENVIGWLNNGTFQTGNGIYPAVRAGVDVQIAIPRGADKSGVDTIRAVTQAAADGRDVSPGAVAIANLWHVGSGGERLRLAGLSVSGSGMNELMDDALPARIFSEELAMVQKAESIWGQMIARVTYNWWSSEAGASQTLWQNRAPHFYGVNPDGTAYDFASEDLEHCLIDTTGRGYGMFAANTKVDVMYPGITLKADAQSLLDPPNINYTTDGAGVRIEGRIRQNAAPAYQQRRDFLTASPVSNAGVATISPALCRFGDYSAGVKNPGNAQVGSHPALQHSDGQILFSQDLAFSLLCSWGHAAPSRLIRTENAPDGAYVDFIYSLPSGAVLSTQRMVEGESVINPRPHQQEVMGYVMRRVGDTARSERPVYRADNTDAVAYPLAYRGTVTIHDSGADVAGGREGTVRITPVEPLQNGDQLRWGCDGGYGGFILHGFPDYDAYLYRDGLRAYEARLDDGSAYAYPGGPVVNQEEMTVMGVAEGVDPGEGTARVAKQNGDDAWLSGPAVGAGVSALTMLFKGCIGVQEGFGRKGLVSLTSEGFRLDVDARAAHRKARVVVEDSNGVKIFNKYYGANSIAAGATEEMTLLVTATQDDGSGIARMALYLDGALLEEVQTAPASGSAVFEMFNTFEILGGNVASIAERVAIWTAYSADGSEPDGADLLCELKGDAAYWNGSGLPDGWAKEGADLFVDEV